MPTRCLRGANMLSTVAVEMLIASKPSMNWLPIYKHLAVLSLLIYVTVLPEPPPARFNNRRKSVFAETYDPEEDDSDEGAPVVFPKSDAQRQRLAEAVRGILLFRSLDSQQMQQVSGHDTVLLVYSACFVVLIDLALEAI